MPTGLPRIALTMGDPAGIGPELCCRVATMPTVTDRYDLTVIGSETVLAGVAERIGLGCPPQILTTDPIRLDQVQVGRVAEQHGRCALRALEAGIDGCLDGRYEALVTAPINKAAIAASGCPHPGHTELLAERCGSAEVGMLLAGGGLHVALVTIHQPLREAIAAIDSDGIVRTARLLDRSLRDLLGRAPRIAVLGLNPHAGEQGRFGDEEQTIIAPAVAALRAAGCLVSDPLPPDTAFTPQARDQYDGHVCLYHDQGLIPFKALAFDCGVNLTMGLPIIRSSPDHGTAFDIAWQGIASPASLLTAIDCAGRLALQRRAEQADDDL